MGVSHQFGNSVENHPKQYFLNARSLSQMFLTLFKDMRILIRTLEKAPIVFNFKFLFFFYFIRMRIRVRRGGIAA